MSGPSIYRARALQWRAQRAERPLPPPPIPSVRTVGLMWAALLLALAGLAALGVTVEHTLARSSADDETRAQEER